MYRKRNAAPLVQAVLYDQRDREDCRASKPELKVPDGPARSPAQC